MSLLTERQRKQIVLLVKHVNHWQNAAYELGYPREDSTTANSCGAVVDDGAFRRPRFPSPKPLT
jgi:hypothetical protein